VTAALDSAAIQHLLEQFGLDANAIAELEALGAALSERSPEALQAARGESALAGAASPFFMPLLPAAMTEPQRALVSAIARGALGGLTLPQLLQAWTQTLNPEEPSERALRDCRPLQELLRSGALRVYAGDAAQCEAALAAADRLGAVQFALIAEAAARSQGRPQAATGLADFMAQVDACVAARIADGRQMAMLFVDCGVIGRVDGVWGYIVGDGVRERLGARLRNEVLRAQDLLGHPGRDQFICVLADLHSAGVATLATEKLLRALDQPLWVDVEEVYARPAVGIAVYPEHGASGVELLQRARVSARAARERPERFALYSADQERSEVELLLYENRLRTAIAQDALDIVFQAQRDLRTGLIVGAESQLRWRDASLGAVPMEKAIAAAESAGLVNEVTLWLVNGALRNCRQFRDTAGLDLRVSVTLSAKSLRQADLPDFVLSALKTWNLRPSRLSLEITDTAVLAASLESVETLQRLREAGIRLSLDDPSAGYASLAWLSTLPFHELRVDLANVGSIVDSPQHLALVRALVEFAHRLKMDVLVAGVDDEESAARLQTLGCDLIQGAVISAPLETPEFMKKFRED
jgi:diguanylate cyclase (GGDEF)-like protein